MKIVLLITDYGSFNNFLGELSEQLVLEKNEVYVICDKNKVINYDDKFQYSELGIKFHFVNFSRNFGVISKIKTSRIIKSIIESIKPDIVNLHFTSGIFISLLSGKIPYKTLGVFHGLGFPVITNKFKKYIFKKIEFFCFRRLDQIWLINEFDFQLVKTFYPETTYKFNSYGVGCDLSKFDKNRFSINDILKLKSELKIENGEFVIMFTGRYVHFKGFDLVVKAMKFIEEDLKVSNFKLLLVGGFDQAHSSGLTSLEERYLQNSKNIVNVGFTNEVERYLSITDLFVFPSTKEGMPVCIMEAIAMGTPVLTLNSRGCNDIVKNESNGILLDIKSDHIKIAHEIITLYNDRNKLSLFSQNAIAMRDSLDRSKFIKESRNIFNKNIS